MLCRLNEELRIKSMKHSKHSIKDRLCLSHADADSDGRLSRSRLVFWTEVSHKDTR